MEHSRTDRKSDGPEDQADRRSPGRTRGPGGADGTGDQRSIGRPLRTPRFQRVTARIIATVHLALGARTVTT
ncbi:hypothetical protein SHIRM173S_03558 [Streptomyces hirsutus]